MSGPSKMRAAAIHLCFVATGLLVATPIGGADEGCLRERGRIPLGAIGAISSDPPYLIYGSGSALVIDDVFDPRYPRRVGQLDLRTPILDLKTRGYITYAGTQQGLHIIDIRIPRAPRHLSFVATKHPARGVAVHGWRAWVVGLFDDETFRGGSTLIHVGRPEDPWVMSAGFLVSCGPRDVELQYPLLFFIGCDLKIFDLSQSPHIPIGRLNVSGHSIAVDGTVAAVTRGDRLQLIDISDPFDPVAKGDIWTHGTAKDVALFGDLAVGSSQSGLTIANITSLDNPLEESHPSFLCGATSIEIADGLVYAANRGFLRVLSLDDPAAPSEISRTGEVSYIRAAASGRLAVTTTHGSCGPREDEITVLDIGRNTPTAVGGWRSIYRAADVALVGTTAFVTADGGLYALDLSDPTNPVELSFIDLIESEYLAVNSGHAYIATMGSAGPTFKVVDVSDPTDMHERGRSGWERGGPSPIAVDAAGDTAVIADTRGLQVFDVSDSRHVDQVGYWPREGATGVALVGDHAVLGYSSRVDSEARGIAVIDLENPDGPTAAGAWASPSAVTAVAEYGGRVLVGTISDGVYLIDLTDPTNPRPVDRWFADQLSTRDLAADWPLIVNSNGTLGLTVIGLDRRCLPPRRPSSRTAPTGNVAGVSSARLSAAPSRPLESVAGSGAAGRGPAGREP